MMVETTNLTSLPLSLAVIGIRTIEITVQVRDRKLYTINRLLGTFMNLKGIARLFLNILLYTFNKILKIKISKFFFKIISNFNFQIITNPNLLFVDEPTSGLDSFMAESVITALQNIAKEGKTVLATIHQPSSETFALFDR